jgi:hypothetical protein
MIKLAWIHIDKAHVDGRERFLEHSRLNAFVGSLVRIHGTLLRNTGISVRVSNIVSEPSHLAAPVCRFVGLPSIRPACSETAGLETHRLEGDMASELQQVCP